ncbi:hypothetical protein BU23DRAFT_595837 [Bimuria novae-zelandiae CBS 107.79]|uniref:Stc1 domain-containing protein n=1 Tax=Bimuria novae-zelandiae CBS 107.79 TaxID=1447943 RepID=A0A6A5VJZ8_9PLEO|nr:hypothetical protein BU23DRAFT_595837 [Bimuria novae-zelandiae CBS 107.79]
MPRHNQVYDPAVMRALEGVRIPAKLKCDRCNKYKGHNAFSNKQLTDARYKIKNEGQSARYKIKCMPCTGQQPVEILCSVCSVWKGLEAFAKSQRKKIDSSECFQCTEKRLSVDPVSDKDYDADNRSRAFRTEPEWQPSVFDVSQTSDTTTDWDEDEGDSGTDGGVCLSEGFTRKLSITESSQVDTLIGAEFDRGSQSSHNDGWQTVESRSWHTPSGRSQTTPTISNTSSRGFNPNNYGWPGAPRSVSGSQHSFASSVAERSEDSITMSANGTFAKIKAYKPEMKENQSWSSDEESDEDGASDEDDDSDGEL